MSYEIQQPQYDKHLVERAWNLSRKELLEEAAPLFNYILQGPIVDPARTQG